jgi:hypothetical protein
MHRFNVTGTIRNVSKGQNQTTILVDLDDGRGPTFSLHLRDVSEEMYFVEGAVINLEVTSSHMIMAPAP